MGLWDRFRRWLGAAPEPSEPSEAFEPPEPSLEPAIEPVIEAPRAPDPEPEPPGPTLSRNLELEAELRARPDDLETFAVYADWLEARGDPRAALIRHGLHRESDPKAQMARRRRIEDLAYDALGGWPRYEEAEVRWRLGFVHTLLLRRRDAEVLRRLVEHPACALIRCVEVDYLSPFESEGRAVLDALPGSVELLSSHDSGPLDEDMIALAAKANRRPGGLRVEFEDEAWMGLDYGHAYLVRTTVAGQTWWYGSDSAQVEDWIADEGASTETIPTEAAEAYVECRMEIGRSRADFAGTVKVGERVLLPRVAPLSGPPFEPPGEVEEVPGVTHGPRLGLEHPALATLPERGHLTHGDAPARLALLGPEGPVQLPQLTPEGDVYAHQYFGGPGGRVAVIWFQRGGGGQILTFGLDAPRHRPLDHGVVTLRWTEAGVLFGDYYSGTVGQLAADGEPQHEWSIPAPEHGAEFEQACVFDQGDSLWALCHGRPYRLRAGEPPEPLPGPRALHHEGRHYGAGPAAGHPEAGRVAWMMCANLGPPMSFVGWADETGVGHVVLPGESGQRFDTGRYATCAVLPDGRIIAAGEALWLVDPPHARRLGVNVELPPTPIITRTEEGRWRLWTLGPGPWWLDFD